MEELEKIVQQDFYKIVNELKRCNGIEIYYDLVCKLNYLEELIFLKGLNINYPREYEYEFYKKNLKNKQESYNKKINEFATKYFDYDKKVAKMANYLNKRYVDIGNII